MKRLASILALVASITASAQTLSVVTDTNGNLLAPTNFFSQNSGIVVTPSTLIATNWLLYNTTAQATAGGSNSLFLALLGSSAGLYGITTNYLAFTSNSLSSTFNSSLNSASNSILGTTASTYLTQTAAVAGYTPQISITTSGTNLTVGSATLYDVVGNAVPITGATLSLPVGTFIIVADLKDGTLHFWERTVDEGVIKICNVTATSSALTVNNRYPLELPTSKIPRTKAKLQSGAAVNVVLLGDSILNGAYSTNNGNIKSLLFNPASNSGTNYNVIGSSNVTVTDWTLGGTKAEYGAMNVGRIVGEASVGLDYLDTVHVLTPYTASLNGVTSQPLGDAPILANTDLVIWGYVVNGGQEYLAYTFQALKRLRERGVEVIILTGNPTSGTTYYGDAGLYLLQIGNALGCQVCDTWANFKEQSDAGLSNYGDASLHPNNLGYTAYARVIDAALNGFVQRGSESGAPMPNVNVMAGINPTNNSSYTTYPTPSQFPTRMDLIFKFPNTTGSASNTQSSTYNMAVQMGAKASSSGVTILTNGQYAMFHHPMAKAVYVIRENDGSNPTYTISYNAGGTAVYTNAISDSTTTTRVDLALQLGTGANVGMENLLTSGSYLFSAEAANYRPFGGRITCTSGTVKIVGIAIATDDSDSIPYERCRLSGTWAEEAGIHGYSVTKYTATTNSSISIPFRGAGVLVNMSTRSNTGTIAASLDGGAISTSVNYYHNGGSYTGNFFWFANPAGTGTQGTAARGDHILTLTLVNYTNSAAANEPLGIYDIIEIKPPRSNY